MLEEATVGLIDIHASRSLPEIILIKDDIFILPNLFLHLRRVLHLRRPYLYHPSIRHIRNLRLFLLLLNRAGKWRRIFPRFRGKLGLDVVDEQGIHSLDGLI